VSHRRLLHIGDHTFLIADETDPSLVSTHPLLADHPASSRAATLLLLAHLPDSNSSTVLQVDKASKVSTAASIAGTGTNPL
jgi:hypothetical protein